MHTSLSLIYHGITTTVKGTTVGSQVSPEDQDTASKHDGQELGSYMHYYATG